MRTATVRRTARRAGPVPAGGDAPPMPGTWSVTAAVGPSEPAGDRGTVAEVREG